MLHLRFILIGLGLATIASAQVSVEEAQRRLREKLSTRPASNHPETDEERIRRENTRLREENLSLRAEVASLRDVLTRAGARSPATAAAGAATQPGSGSEAILGRWRGGTLAAGNAFISQFNPDGTYREEWLSPQRSETGKYQFISDDIVEMWTDRVDAPHQRWSVTSNENELTLQPVNEDGKATGVKLNLRRERS